jgi:pimeloyl-ACP methyl ester carboxylesterase
MEARVEAALPKVRGTSHAPYTFSLVLRAEDAEPRASWVRDRRHVVLLHGWLQDHSCWLSSAHELRRRYGHSVLLLDWMHHGRSESPIDPTALGPDALVRQLRAELVRLGWAGADTVRKLTIGGCSLGGAVAMLYTTRYAAEVDRLVLIAPAGFDEPWPRFMLHVGRLGAGALRRAAAGAGGALWHRLLAHAHLIETTPRYGNDPNWFDTPIARTKPTLLVGARFDELHRASDWAACRQDDPSFRLRLLPVNHTLLCQHLHCLRLDRDPANWHDGPHPMWSKL